jgi:hypothetical protein
MFIVFIRIIGICQENAGPARQYPPLISPQEVIDPGEEGRDDGEAGKKLCGLPERLAF